MSQNLELLRQKYCKSATIASAANHNLFALERESDEGKIFMAKAPAALLQIQEFDSTGLGMTYRDETTGAELPVFAVFNLEETGRCSFEIGAEMFPAVSEPGTLRAMLPLNKSQPYVRKINEGRAKAQRALTIIAGLLGILPGIAFLLSPMGETAGVKAPFVFLAGWLLGSMLAYIVTMSFLDRVCPWKKLVITAEFDGILPREAREKAMVAKEHFDKLYLVVDQQNRWKSEVLPDPAPRALDPLLVGEVEQAGKTKYFVICQFDLTDTEQYLADEFAIRTG
jgi:hypothetical protein